MNADALDSTAGPSFAEALDVPARPDRELWGELKRPFPTNEWWTPACLEGGAWTIHPLPYQLRLERDKAAVCYPDYLVAEKYIGSIFVDHFCVGCLEPLLGHRVVAHDDLSATFAWKSGKSETAMKCPVVQGSPYASFFFSDSTPQLTSRFAIAADFQGEYRGNIFRIPLNNGQTWMIYVSKNITFRFNVNPMVIEATEPFNGVIRVAMVPESEEAAKLLDKCRNSIPVGGAAQAKIQDTTMTYAYDYQTEGMVPILDEGDLLMMALPHHLKMNLPTALEGAWYRSIKGPMLGVKGKRWEMKMEIVEVGWNSLQKIDQKHADIVRGALYAESTMEVHNTDPYAFGKRVAAMGRLAIIADELGEDDVALNVRERMKRELEPWLQGKNSNALVYDPVWGGLISTEGSRNPGADYGSGMYNDHHFQYGYFIYATAAIGKGDREWLNRYLHPITNLLRDFANPSPRDPFFPRLRHFDLYACHSWASGIFCFQDGKNQESTSEAINAYYAVSLLGTVLENAALTELGAALMHLEILATHSYWHIPTEEASIYPEPFCKNGTVGILWSGKVDYGTWFGPNLEYIHCIQMLPFLPVSELVLGRSWVQRVEQCIGALKDDPKVEVPWRGFLWMAVAVYDKEAAWKGFLQLDGKPDLGNSITNALYWIATRPGSQPPRQTT